MHNILKPKLIAAPDAHSLLPFLSQDNSCSEKYQCWGKHAPCYFVELDCLELCQGCAFSRSLHTLLCAKKHQALFFIVSVKMQPKRTLTREYGLRNQKRHFHTFLHLILRNLQNTGVYWAIDERSQKVLDFDLLCQIMIGWSMKLSFVFDNLL
ncbi:hypothetical protein EGR_08398 [Echinococcus granulosus]|uniref:Uncharacterized protein n=1 Tax=Echinococcus granulosus TaxID=6210 RepID=W6U6E7_ECHGR|nr:hypothetical protein EGR_08398 [Echinococcus granulosus]EUB56755.1 hypothetical protein EGR_08398 [Echinococcus granulosus]